MYNNIKILPVSGVSLIWIHFLVILFLSFSAQSYGANREDPSLETIKQTAEKGDAESQYLLGKRYLLGEGVEKNDGVGCEWFLKAAEQGHAKAQFKVAVFYDKGAGVAKDRAWAVQWYKKATSRYMKAASQFPGADGVI